MNKYSIPKHVDLVEVKQNLQLILTALNYEIEVKVEPVVEPVEVKDTIHISCCVRNKHGQQMWGHVRRSKVYQGEVDEHYKLRAMIAAIRNAVRKFTGNEFISRRIGAF